MTASPRETEIAVMEQAIAWFVRQDCGDMLPEEQAAFRRWKAAPDHAAAWARVERMWGDFDHVPSAQRPRPTRSSPFRFGALMWRHAALALAACVILTLSVLLDFPTRLRADLRTDTGETAIFSLPDGSSVSLDGGGALSLAFTPDRRVVRLLRGEALFSVVSDPARPFVVEAGDGSVQALGTQFIVRRVDDTVAVTVLESHVRVTCCGKAAATLILAPDRQVRYSARDGLGAARIVDARSEAAWTRGKLIFTDRPLSMVVDELNRHFPGHIALYGGPLRNRTVNGVFSTTDPAAALVGLRQSLGLHITRITPWLVVLHD